MGGGQGANKVPPNVPKGISFSREQKKHDFEIPLCRSCQTMKILFAPPFSLVQYCQKSRKIENPLNN